MNSKIDQLKEPIYTNDSQEPTSKMYPVEEISTGPATPFKDLPNNETYFVQDIRETYKTDDKANDSEKVLTIEEYYKKAANFDLSQEFMKRNLLFEVESKDADLIPQSATCLRKFRRNSVFFMDMELNLVEYDAASRSKKMYLNQEKIGDFESLKDEDHVQMVIAQDFSCLAILVVRMEKKIRYEATRY